MKHVWLLIGSDTETKWVEAVFTDKVMAEALMRTLTEEDKDKGGLHR